MKFKLLFTLSFFFTLFIAFNYSAQWLGYCIFWFALGYLSFFKFAEDLEKFKKFIFTIIILYPLLESILKVMIDSSIFLNNLALLNRAEHFIWSFSFTIIILPFFKKLLNLNELLILSLLLFEITNSIGVVNEFVEYLFREIGQLKFYAYYPDTILDLAMNMFGGIVAVFIISVIWRNRNFSK